MKYIVFESSKDSDFNLQVEVRVNCRQVAPVTFSYSEDGQMLIDGETFNLKDTSNKGQESFSRKCEIFTETGKQINHERLMKYLLDNQFLIPNSWISFTAYHNPKHPYFRYRRNQEFKLSDTLCYMPIVFDSVWIFYKVGIGHPAMVYDPEQKIWVDKCFLGLPAFGRVETM